MRTRDEAIAYCLSLGDAYLDKPFQDQNWSVVRHESNKKIFAWIFEKNSHIWINVKCEPGFLYFWRDKYNSIVPGFHLNKDHWNSIILDGTVPEEDIYDMIERSYTLTESKK